MKELIEFIAKSVVEKPEEVKVTQTEEEGKLLFKLSVAPDDMGKVIGKQGRIAQAMRTLLRVAAIRKGVKASLQIIQESEGEAR